MGRLVVQTFLSVDGVMQSPGDREEDREGGFDHGGWLAQFFDDDLWGAIADAHDRAGALLLGRKTYDGMAGYWPGVTERENPLAVRMNSLPKYVASRVMTTADWHNTTVLGPDVAARVASLKDAHAGEVQVLGSGDLVRTLLAHDLVDEFRIWVFPVVLGRGKRLFPEGVGPFRLESADVTRIGRATIHVYRRTGSA